MNLVELWASGVEGTDEILEITLIHNGQMTAILDRL